MHLDADGNEPSDVPPDVMDIVTRKAVSGLERLGSQAACLTEATEEVSHERE